MNKSKWASIAPADQAIIAEINKEWAVKHGEAWDSSDMDGIRAFLQEGNDMIGLDRAESTRWEKAVEPLIAGYIKDLKEADGKAVEAAIREILKRFE